MSKICFCHEKSDDRTASSPEPAPQSSQTSGYGFTDFCVDLFTAGTIGVPKSLVDAATKESKK